MKRSEINQIMAEALAFLGQHQFHLPPFAHWTPAAWRAAIGRCDAIFQQQLGWDITDFGSGDFERVGLLMFTLRNGTLEELKKPLGKIYGEKLLIVRPGQLTPTHFHHQKMEDIINRGGGRLIIQLWNATPDNELADSEVRVWCDGLEVRVPAGGTVQLAPGESVCLPQRLYHAFWAEETSGPVLAGEVNRVNDDRVDNHFHRPVGRFPRIEEDTPPLHLLVGDYEQFRSVRAN